MNVEKLSLTSLATALTLYGAGSAWAQTPPIPNAGQVLRELQQNPGLGPTSAPPQRIEESVDSGQELQRTVLVNAIHFTGNQEISSAELMPLVAALVGTEHSLTQLNATARRITAWYRAKGFAVARAYLPTQDVTDGAITIAIVEGRIAGYKVNNQARISNERAQAPFSRIKDGDVIKSEQIDRSLLLLQDTPGVGSSRATLQPGASVGTSDLVVEITPGAAYSGSVDLDNYGNRYIGEYRLSGALNINSPLQIGDVLSVNVLSSGNGLNYGRAAYQLPIGSDGFRVGVAYSDAVYKLGKEFKTLDAHGTASSASLFAAYPVIRSLQTNLNGTVSLEQKKLSDSVTSTLTTTDKRVTLSTIGLQAGHQDGLGGGGYTSGNLSVIIGKLDIQSASALTIDAASAQTNGRYIRLAYALSRLQRLSDTNTLSLAVSGQETSKNLDSSEKFTLGGNTGVRAYPQGEANGDSGYLATAEVRHNFGDALQVILFYDTGRLWINKTPFGVATANQRTLSGAGIGLNANLADFRLRTSIAWRAGSEQATSIPASAVQTPTIWVQLSKGF